MMKNEVFLAALRDARLEYTVFASRYGFDPRTVKNWIDQTRTPGPLNASRVEEILGVSRALLWPERYAHEELRSPISVENEMYGLRQVFLDRSVFKRHYPTYDLVEGAEHIRLLGVSLNHLCQELTGTQIINLVKQGLQIECLFLYPHGRYVTEREREEDLPLGTISRITIANIHTLYRIKSQLPEEDRANISLRTYDETMRYNIMFIDDHECIMQSYLPYARGIDNPVFLINNTRDLPNLYGVYQDIFQHIWDKADEFHGQY